jgi:branched-subunit amino acid transport protein
METFYLVAGMALVTFTIRFILIPLSGRIKFSQGIQRALSYVPPAVLTAIIVPAAAMPDGHTLRISITNPYLVGTVLTALIGWFGKRLLLTIIGGMAFFFIFQWLLTGLGF